MEHYTTRTFLTWAVAILSVAVLFYNQHQGLKAHQLEMCHAINQTKSALITYIDQQITRSETTIPNLTYYKQHPGELGKQLLALSEQRQDTMQAFAPTSC